MRVYQGPAAVHRRTIHAIGMVVLLAALLAVSPGCDPAPDEEVRLREPVQSMLEWQRQALAGGGQPAGGEAVQRFYALRQDLRIPERRATAEAQVWQLIEQEPENLLWLEALLIRRRYLDEPARVDSLSTARVAVDSTGAVAEFLKARRWWGQVDDAELGFFAALEDSAELDAVSRAWLELRCAVVADWRGDPEQALARMADVLPSSWRAGGAAMATSVWVELSSVLRNLGWLTESLEAANMALACAERDGSEIGRIRGHLAVSRSHEARADYEQAWSEARVAGDLADHGGHQRWQQDIHRSFTYLLTSLGDGEAAVAQGAELLELSLAMADSPAVIVAGTGLATYEANLGNYEAAEEWARLAEQMDDAYSRADFSGRISMLRWSLAMQSDRVAEADSLFAQARRQLRPKEQSVLLIDAMEFGLDHGRPMLVRESLNLLREDPQLLVPDAGYDPRRDVTLLAAVYHARQGDFAAAYAELDRHAELIAVGAPAAAHWSQAYNVGRIAEIEGDAELAIASYELALEHAQAMDNQRLVARSRIRLGEVLVRAGRAPQARALFDAVLDSPDYWSQVAAALMTGCALAAEDRHEEALERLAAVESMLASGGPAELRRRIALEMGRSFLALRQPREVLDRLAAVRDLTPRAPTFREKEIYQAFFRPLTVEIVELEIAAMVAAATDRDASHLALATLAATEKARWQVDRGEAPDALQSIGRLRVREGAPVLTLFEGPTRSYIWIGTHAGWRIHEVEDPRSLAGLIRRVAADLSHPATTMDAAALSELSRRLLAPVRSHWKANEIMSVMAPGIFAAVPWPALPLDPNDPAGPTVVDHGPVAHIASFDGLAPDLTAPERMDLLAVGYDGDEVSGSLRFAGSEAQAIAEQWDRGESVVLVGEDSSWEHLVKHRPGRFDVIHIATHGILQAGAASEPVLWLAAAADQEPVDAERVRSLALDADLVYLSCCEGGSIASDRGLGLDSLARAFLQTGTQAVVASGAALDDRAALDFATAFYAQWRAGRSMPEALRQAQLEQRARGGKRSHPFYWANFQVHLSSVAKP